MNNTEVFGTVLLKAAVKISLVNDHEQFTLQQIARHLFERGDIGYGRALTSHIERFQTALNMGEETCA